MAISEAERNAQREQTKEKLTEKKYDGLRRLGKFSDLDSAGTSNSKVLGKADLTVNQIPKALTASLKSTGMFREDYFEDAFKFTYNDAGVSNEQNRTFVQIKYKPKITGSRKFKPDLVHTISGSTDTEVYENIDEQHKNIFTEMLATASADLKVKRLDFIKTDAVGGDVHKVIIKNKNPINAPMVLLISQSAS